MINKNVYIHIYVYVYIDRYSEAWCEQVLYSLRSLWTLPWVCPPEPFALHPKL